jgi:hypothetical protein
MGSWSVYCGISNITIHEGDDALLVPLEKANGDYNNNDKYKLVIFPIFGSYNDYGEIGYIKKDFNTELIEEEYKCSIEDFCSCLVRNDIENDYGNLSKEKAERIKLLSYMWIKKDVWDFLINFKPKSFRRNGHFDLGDEKILNYLGFKFVGIKKNDTRYNKIYK